MNSCTLFILDGHALLYRSYYALAAGHLNAPDGTPTGAVVGFINTIRDILNVHRPDRFVAAFDPKGDTFRKTIYPDYKANRKEMPDDLKRQVPLCLDVCDAYGVPVFQDEKHEADDVIATLALRAVDSGWHVVIVSGDKDLMQIIRPEIHMLDLKSGDMIDEDGVRKQKGVSPLQIPDYLALIGDSSDNVPGVNLIGPKAAVRLLTEHGTLEAVLDDARRRFDTYTRDLAEYEKKLAEWEQAADDGQSEKKSRGRKPKKPKALKAADINLVEERDKAHTAYKLVTLITNLELPIAPDDLPPPEKNPDKLAALYERTNIHALAEDISPSGKDSGDEPSDYRIVRTAEEFNAFIALLKQQDRIAFDTETTGLDPMTTSLVGMSFSFKPHQAWYLPLMAPELFDETLDTDTTLAAVKPILEDPSVKKIGQNMQFDGLVMRRYDIHVSGKYIDTMIADWLLDPGQSKHDLDTLSLRYIGYKKIPTSDLIGSKGMTMADVPVDVVGNYACEDADTTFRIAAILEERLKEEGLDELFFNLEMPLVDVLEDITHTGFAVDSSRLKRLSAELSDQIEAVTKQIHEAVGHPLMVNSNPQLAHVLFEELGYPIIKKSSKTKKPSTDEDVMTQLISHPDVSDTMRRLPKLILEYREHQKLKSTYADALPKMVNPKTGRIHTRFNQIGTVTGRLSSSSPNLQNIPIRTEAGRKIRAAFIPGEPGWKLIGFDYSQIELRILAHVSGDETLRNAFLNGVDIHRAVAARLNGVSENDVTPEQRSAAKAVNFGIIYGQTDFGLANALSIPRRQAKKIIDDYFASHPGVRRCIDGIIEQARKDRFVMTLMGRRRFLPDIESGDFSRRKFMERIAVNTRIQGTAADLIKRAMLDIHDFLNRNATRAKMLLQIHDELIFEAPENEIAKVSDAVKTRMESAIELDVPLIVDQHTADTWEGLK